MRPALGLRCLASCALVIGLGAGIAYARAKNTATEPAPREEGWIKVHEAYLKQASERPCELLFLGDSITQGWNAGGRETWERFYNPRKVLNFGIGGDRTQHVLWRIDQGEVDKLKPKVVVLMIGTNNIGSNTTEEIAEGVKAIVDRLRSKLPETKILLLGVFPRGGERDRDSAAVDPRPAAINAIISRFDDGKTIKYLDIGKAFLNDEGRISKSVMPDFLHLTSAAYRSWADAMEPTLWDLMEGK